MQHRYEGRLPRRAGAAAAALDALLCDDSAAMVAALSADAVMVPMPAAVPLRGQSLFEDRSGLELAIVEDRIAIIEAWERVQHEPVVRVDVHLLADPGRVSTIHLFDLRAEYGVHVLVLETQDRAAVPRSIEVRAAMRRPVAHAKRDASSVFIEVDEATTSLLGWSAADLIGHSTLDYVHPEDADRAIQNWMAVRAGEGSGRVRVRYRHASGQHIWLEVTNDNRLDDPELRCVMSEMVDISDEMSLIEELRERESLLARLAEALPIGICHVRSDGQVAYSNEPLVALLGAVDSTDALVCGAIGIDRRQVETALDDAFRGRPCCIEIGVSRRHGEMRCELTFRPMTAEGGMVDGIIVCATDVTERSRLRAALEHRASHDALTGCLNRAAMMTAIERALLESQHVAVAYIDLEHFKAINDEVGHAAGDELLRVSAARLRGVTRVGDEIARVGGDEFVVLYRRNDEPIDALALGKRLTEAINGDVVFAKHRIPLGASVGVATALGGELDAETVLNRADTAMYAAKRRSRARSGIASRQVTELDVLGWDLTQRAHHSAPLRPAREENSDLTRVLVVDDDVSMRTLLRLTLEGNEFVVVDEAQDGRDAVAMARHHQPDLVLLDLAMPGVGGLEVLPLIRAVAPQAQVVVISGIDPEDLPDQSRLQGAAGYLCKGADPERYLDDLRRLLTA